MIKPSKDGKLLYFIPPEKSSEQELEFDLIQAYSCPKCNNLVQAIFHTDKLIDTKPWEEILTNQLEPDGIHFRRIIPGRSERFKSRYSNTILAPRNKIQAQMIKFTEHFDSRIHEGVNPLCNYVALTSLIPEYKLYDLMLLHNMDAKAYTINDSHYDIIKEGIMKSYNAADNYIIVPAIGNGPEAFFVNRQAQQWILNMTVQKFIKEKVNGKHIF